MEGAYLGAVQLTDQKNKCHGTQIRRQLINRKFECFYYCLGVLFFFFLFSFFFFLFPFFWRVGRGEVGGGGTAKILLNF